jgi:hypothetical protein
MRGIGNLNEKPPEEETTERETQILFWARDLSASKLPYE